MLYLSRYTATGYGVVDTDDDVEEIVGYSDLREIVEDIGISIEGVTLFQEDPSCNYDMAIAPYQDKRYLTKSMLKMKTMYGVDIRVWRDEIVFIGIDKALFKEGFRLRLSDYGKRFAAWTPIRAFDWSKQLVFVIDDKVDIPDNKLPVGSTTCCAFDITNWSHADDFYKDLLDPHPGDYFNWDEDIIDKPERLMLAQTSASLFDNAVPKYMRETVQQSPYYGYVSKELGVRFYDSFNEFVDYIEEELACRDGAAVRDYIKKELWLAVLNGTPENRSTVMQFIRRYSTVNTDLRRSFDNYLKWFIATPEVDALFKRLCKTLKQYVV